MKNPSDHPVYKKLITEVCTPRSTVRPGLDRMNPRSWEDPAPATFWATEDAARELFAWRLQARS